MRPRRPNDGDDNDMPSRLGVGEPACLDVGVSELWASVGFIWTELGALNLNDHRSRQAGQ